MFETLQPLVLASASPRRRELLQSAGLRFRVVASGVEEIHAGDESPEALVRRWAKEKAMAVSRAHPGSWVLAADTLVILEGRIFGKPADALEALELLEQLSGNTHTVASGVCVMRRGREAVGGVVQTRVRFKPLSRGEIQAYVRTGHPLDKAGAYGIQGPGAFLVEWIRGSYTNVVGLPLCETLQWLLDLGVVAPAASPAGRCCAS